MRVLWRKQHKVKGRKFASLHKITHSLKMSNFFYILALTLLITHELDAIYRHEWRIFPLLNKLDEQLSAKIFILAHIPLFFIIFWLSFYASQTVSEMTRITIAGFCIIHVGLHILLRKHPKNEFNNPISQFLIWSCAMSGALYLIL